jgi:hypothetical protein
MSFFALASVTAATGLAAFGWDAGAAGVGALVSGALVAIGSVGVRAYVEVCDTVSVSRGFVLPSLLSVCCFNARFQPLFPLTACCPGPRSLFSPEV